MHIALSQIHPDRHLLAELLDQQMWFFGCDIRHPGGNLLLAKGFVRDRPPAEISSGTSRYAGHTPEGRLVLWGWGVLWMAPGAPAGLLRRHGSGPRLLCAPPDTSSLWEYKQADALPTRESAAESLRVVASFARWVVRWESAVRTSCGDAWRARCAADRPRRIRRRHEIADHDYVAAWERVAALGHHPSAAIPSESSGPAQQKTAYGA
jgi:hypothetical protein